MVTKIWCFIWITLEILIDGYTIIHFLKRLLVKVVFFYSVIDYCTSQEEATVFSGNSEMIEYTIEGFNEGRYQLIGVDAR